MYQDKKENTTATAPAGKREMTMNIYFIKKVHKVMV